MVIVTFCDQVEILPSLPSLTMRIREQENGLCALVTTAEACRWRHGMLGAKMPCHHLHFPAMVGRMSPHQPFKLEFERLVSRNDSRRSR